jgi:hypothetical protein
MDMSCCVVDIFAVRVSREGWRTQWSQPHPGKSQNPVAWIAGRKETESWKPIDKAILGMVSESSGRNESERKVASKIMNSGSRAFESRVKAAWTVAI